MKVNGVDLCAETFGDRTNPAILLVSGASSSMDWWEDAFCERLADGGRWVIRYDLRDTGRSESYPQGAPEYTGEDLVADAVGLLDALAIRTAHVVGISMGAGLAQVLAVEHPARVDSLVLLSTSPALPRDAGVRQLPMMSDELRAALAEARDEPDWSDREAVIDHIVEGNRPFQGTVRAEDSVTRAIAGSAFDRTPSMASSLTNHGLIENRDVEHPPMNAVRAPTLVVHGTEDPLFPHEHGVALAEEIPGARLLSLEGLGHELPPLPLWDVVIPAILDHTARPGPCHT